MAILATFDEEELSRNYKVQPVGGPNYETGIVGNGKAIEQRNINRYDAVRTFTLPFGGMPPPEKRDLESFFLTKFGKAIGFRLFPPSDYNFLNDVIGIGDGATTTFYMKRHYSSRTRCISRRIVKPVRHKVVVTVDGEKVPFDDPELGEFYPAGDYPELDNPTTVDWAQGVIEFETAPADGEFVRCAEGEYNIPVYFDTDGMILTDFTTFSDWDSVGFREILPVALGAAGNEMPTLSLGFITPYLQQEVEDFFNVNFSSLNVSKVYLFVNGEFYGSSTDGPGPDTPGPFTVIEPGGAEATIHLEWTAGTDNEGSFEFLAVPAPPVEDTFLLEAIGTNAAGEIVVATTTMTVVGDVIDGGSPGSSGEWIIDGGMP